MTFAIFGFTFCLTISIDNYITVPWVNEAVQISIMVIFKFIMFIPAELTHALLRFLLAKYGHDDLLVPISKKTQLFSRTSIA